MGSHQEVSHLLPVCVFMTNADSYVRVLKTQLQPTKEEAESDPVILSVERAVVKVIVKNEANTDDDYGTIYEIGGNVTWKLDITNKSTYLIRKPTLTYDGRSEIPTTAVPTPNLLHRYAEDTNFDKGTSSDFNNISVSDIPATQIANTTCWEYAMENTMKADKQYQDVTTRVVVKANYVPKKHTSSTISTGDSYYTYRGYYIKASDMSGYATAPSTIPDEYYGLEATIDEYTSQPGNSLTTEPSESFSFTSSVSDQPLTFYKGGISYYKILIRHFDDTLVPDKMEYGRFGVVRNNEYTINIKSFSGAGEIDISDTEDPENPGNPGPDEGDENWISAKVTIKPWVERSQNNGL